MRRKVQSIGPMRVLVQASEIRWEWVMVSQFAGQEIVILKADGYYVPVKF